jgi:hypothetical protein
MARRSPILTQTLAKVLDRLPLFNELLTPCRQLNNLVSELGVFQSMEEKMGGEW